MSPRFAWLSLPVLWCSSCASPQAKLWRAWSAARPVSMESGQVRYASLENLPQMGRQSPPPRVDGPYFRTLDGRSYSYFNVGFGHYHIAEIDKSGDPIEEGFFTSDGKATANPYP